MATLAQLLASATRKISDATYTDAILTGFFNQCRLELAGMFNFPALKTSVEVETVTDDDHVSLTGFHRDLYHVFNTSTNARVPIYRSLNLLMGEYPEDYGEAGAITGVCEEAGVLYYLRIPAEAETLRCHFYTTPTDLSETTDTPSEIPSHLHMSLLVNFACKEAFSEIYEGDPQGDRAVGLYEQRYAKAITDLRIFLGPYAREPVAPNDVMRWDAL